MCHAWSYLLINKLNVCKEPVAFVDALLDVKREVDGIVGAAVARWVRSACSSSTAAVCGSGAGAHARGAAGRAKLLETERNGHG